MIHYLTREFALKVITLRCAPFSDVRHTGTEIARIIKESLENAGMPLENMVVYVTENASNAVKSARDLGVNHQGCVAHTLNLIVQKFARWKMPDMNQPSMDGIPEQMNKISKAIEVVRDYAKYLSNSTIGSQWIKKSMERSNQSPRMIPVDVATRWNSTLHMIKVALKLRIHLDAFCSYVYTEEGRSAFANCSKIVQISHEQWFILQNVCKVLDPFHLAINILSGEKYPTWSLTFPVLREITSNLMQFAEVGGVPHADWYESAKDTVMVFRDELLKDFKARFRGMDISLLWMILLDPRLAAMNGFNIDERNRAKAFLLSEMKKVPPEAIPKQDQQSIALDDDDDPDISNVDNYMIGSIFSRNDSIEIEESGDLEYSYEDELDNIVNKQKYGILYNGGD